MKKACVMLIVLLVLGQFSHAARSVYCVNCSNKIMQAIEKATGLEQLAMVHKEYIESTTQTLQQIEMVRQNVEQYTNMVKNTINLPASVISKMSGSLMRLASLTGSLKTIRGDIAGLSSVFSTLYTARPDLATWAGASTPAEVAAANEAIQEATKKWSERVDEATQATFQLSGTQLSELQNDSASMQSHIDELLSTPEGRMEALQAGNQLAGIQIQEARQLRELLATQIQSDLASQEKAEKEDQLMREQWKDATKTKTGRRTTGNILY